jgi:hypothetical protein
VGELFGSWQQTETHWVPLTTTVAVVVSVTPVPTSVPGAAPPSFWVTPNHGSAPIWNEPLAGFATMVAVLPGATDAVTVAPVDAMPPLMLTEHQLMKFLTVSVTLPPPPSATPVSPLEEPLELLLDPLLELLDEPLELVLDPPLELVLEPLELVPEPLPDPPLELLFPPSAGAGDELLLHEAAPATASVAIAATPSQSLRLIVLILKASMGGL